jgi:hypothetical protein
MAGISRIQNIPVSNMQQFNSAADRYVLLGTPKILDELEREFPLLYDAFKDKILAERRASFEKSVRDFFDIDLEILAECKLQVMLRRYSSDELFNEHRAENLRRAWAAKHARGS